ncbi:hypothetical protein NQ317_016239, partial [Molorchus minor]
LQCVVALCIRFYNNALKQKKISGRLSINELENAMIRIIKIVQAHEYSNELNASKHSKPIPTNSDDNVIRVGGRLRNSLVEYNLKFPIIFPQNSPLTKLIIRNEHLKQLHAGPHTLLATIRQKYWIINGKTIVKAVFHQTDKTKTGVEINKTATLHKLFEDSMFLRQFLFCFSSPVRKR